MVQMADESDMRVRRLPEHVDVVSKRSVNEVVTELSESLHGGMTNLISKMQSQCETIEMKCDDKIINQSKNTIKKTEIRNRLSAQGELDKNLTRRARLLF